MTRKDLLTMTTVAVTTAMLTMAAFWTAPLEAGGEADALTPEITKPKLSVRGVEVSLAAVAGTERPGDEPVLELGALNTSAETAEIRLRVLMTAMAPPDALSRVVRMPARLWESEQSITLRPNERRTLKLATGTKLPARNIISVTLSEAAPSASAMDSSEPAPLLRPLNSAAPGVAVLRFSTAGPDITLAATGSNS